MSVEHHEIRVDNPRNGELLYAVQEPSAEDIAQVYANAREAGEKLAKMTVAERIAELVKVKRYILENKEAIAQRIVEETGKSLMDAMTLEVFPVLDTIQFYEKNAEKFLKDKKVITPIMLFGKKSKVFYNPIGPVLIISPWNYPFNLSFGPFICAFLAGNPVIMKPSSYTLLKGVCEDIIEGSGFMKHALQVVYASRRTADYLIENKPAKIHFTGSVGAGKMIMKKAAEYLIPVELELGGKDPFIVFDDVDIERTVNGALWGSFSNCGQTCVSVERLYVQEAIYDDFLAMMKEKAERIVTLNNEEARQDEKKLTMGCMTAEFQIETIESQLAEAKEKGATIVTGGSREPGSHILPPTIVADTDPTMEVQWEESFGPVVTVTKFKTEEEAIRLANDSPYGLSSSVWSRDLERAQRVARALVTGNVSINNVMATLGNPALPFGGIKDSGFGRYKGEEGLHAFSNIKSILIDKQSNKTEIYWYPYSPKKFALLSKVIDTVFQGGLLALLKTIPIAQKLEGLAKRDRL